jgi:hypothetical protein
VVAELWAWHDVGGLYWYNYVLAGYIAQDGTALTMCGSADAEDAGAEYECTIDSYLLLFTAPSVFVNWGSHPGGDLHYCESLGLTRQADGASVPGSACGTVLAGEAGEQPPPEEPAPPTTSAPPTTPPTATSAPPPGSEPPTETPPPGPPASATSTPAAEPQPSSSGSTAAGAGPSATNSPSAGSPAADPRDPPADDFAPTPVSSDSVVTVSGGTFPVNLVIVIAVALGFGGVGVLAGPSLLDGRRRRGAT